MNPNEYIELQLRHIPMSISLWGDGKVSFRPLQDFRAIIDEYMEDRYAIYDGNAFKLGDKDYSYNLKYAYKEDEVMLQWLCQLDLREILKDNIRNQLKMFNPFGDVTQQVEEELKKMGL